MPDDQNNLSGEQLDKWNYIDRIISEFSVYGASISDSGDPWGEACAEARAEVLINTIMQATLQKKSMQKSLNYF